jgi:hypothetical protein
MLPMITHKIFGKNGLLAYANNPLAVTNKTSVHNASILVSY